MLICCQYVQNVASSIGGEALLELKYYRVSKEGLAISVAPDKTVADGLYDRVEYWDVTEGKVLRTLKTGKVYNPSGAKPLAFSDDGKLLACALENEVQLWETQTGDLKGSLPLAKTFKVRTASW